MKKIIKRTMATILTIVMLLTAMPLSGIDFCELFAPEVSAKDISSYSVGDTITYGSYPQSKVTDSSLISALETKSSSYLWVDYGYYSGTGDWYDGNMKPSDNMMYYKDISYNGNMYRAVWIKNYRPYFTGCTSSASNSEQDDNGYYSGNVYYFKYEPLTWCVLDPSEGFVMCNKAIDSQAYQNFIYYNSSQYYNSKACTNYASDWATSSIREWLNNDFYNTAFSDSEKSQIGTTYNENKSTYSNTYDSANTSDKIFLLSYNEVLNSNYGFSSSYSTYDTARQIKSTDYAQCQGCYTIYNGNSWWRLRSPYYSYEAAYVDSGGDADSYYYVYGTNGGVVPAFKFNPKSTIPESDTEYLPENIYSNVIEQYKGFQKLYSESTSTGYDFYQIIEDYSKSCEFIDSGIYDFVYTGDLGEKSKICYSFYDIDSNGSVELLISINNEIYSIYSYSANKIYNLITCAAPNGNEYIYVYSNGMIERKGKGGAFYHYWEWYNIDNDGKQLIELYQLEHDNWDEKNEYSIDETVVSETSFVSLFKQYTDLKPYGLYSESKYSIDFKWIDICQSVVDSAEYAIGFDSNVNCAHINTSFTYSDSYFLRQSDEYYTDLMHATLCLALSSSVNDGGNNGDYSQTHPELAYKLFNDIDFENIKDYGYNIPPASTEYHDSVACVMASKNIANDTTVIAISVRGLGYEGEWGSNFNVGTSDEHTGFRRAANVVKEHLKQYIIAYGNSLNNNVKIWITGYSRAAATANLVASDIDKGMTIEGISFDKSSVYSYTFETPLATTDEEARNDKYNNIFNIVNPIDPVPKVAPTAWNFDRYGVDYYTPCAETSSDYGNYLNKVIDYYNEITKNKDGSTKEGIQNIESLTKISNNGITTSLNQAFDSLANNILKSRENYNNNYQDVVCTYFYVCGLNCDPINSIWNELINDYGATEFSLITALINSKNARRNLMYLLFYDVLDGDFSKGFNRLSSDEFIEELNSFADGALKLILRFFYTYLIDPSYTAIKSRLSVCNLIALCMNDSIKYDLFLPHYQEVAYAFIMAEPDRLTRCTDYTKAIFNCPVDINVYNEKNELVAAIIDDVPQQIDNSCIVSCVDENGQKIINLPNDSEYRFEITGRDIGTMTCSFAAMNLMKNSENKLINYYDLPVDKGTVIIATTSKFDSKKNSLEISMTQNENSIESSEILEENRIIRYTINVEQDSEYNYVSGSGTFVKGEYCKVTAIEMFKDSFLGWYVNNELVSVEKEYRFAVTKDKTIIGRFKSHTHNYEWVYNDDATNTADGTESQFCIECGEKGETRTKYGTKHVIKVKSVQIDDVSLNYKQSTTINPKIEADSGVNYEVSYTTSNLRVATVDNNGNLYASGKGSATITCTVTDQYGNIVTDTSNVNVNYSFGQWLIKILLFGWIWY